MVFDSKNIRTWSLLGPSGIFGIAACELAEQNEDFAVVTADLCYFSGLDKFKKKYSSQLYNVGIAEQNMIGIAGGMAKEGMDVWAITYASFASARVLDQVKVNMGYMKLPIHLVGMASGYSVGILGATHMCLEDIAMMRSIPNVTIISPADGAETMKAVLAVSELKQPTYIRMSSGSTRMPVVYKEDFDFCIGKAIEIKKYQGADVAIIATGTMVNVALKVSDILENSDILCDVIDMHTIKPIDEEIILSTLTTKLVVTIEEHSKIGGLGSAVAEVLASCANKPPQIIIGVDDYYPKAASYEKLLEESGLAVDDITKRIMSYVKNKNYCNSKKD